MAAAEDEAALRDNRAAFQRIILRPRALVDVHKIDLSLELLGQKLEYPILLDPAGGKNCFYADGEHVVARAAAAAKALHITNGGIQDLARTGKGPAWWQVETGGSLRNQRSMRALVEQVEGDGGTGICFTTDIMYASHRERNIHNKFERAWCEVGLPKRDAAGKMPRTGEPERAGDYPSRPSPRPHGTRFASCAGSPSCPSCSKEFSRAKTPSAPSNMELRASSCPITAAGSWIRWAAPSRLCPKWWKAREAAFRC